MRYILEKFALGLCCIVGAVWLFVLIQHVAHHSMQMAALKKQEAEMVKIEKEKDAERLRAKKEQEAEKLRIKKEKKLPRVFKMGNTGVRVGNLTYGVFQARWKDYLSNYYSKGVYGEAVTPDAYFLVIDVVVRNDDKRARTIPRFYLIDETGREYETSSKVWVIKELKERVSLDRLNPGMKKYGEVIFDVPRNHSYNLKVSGGFFAGSALFKIKADRY